MMRLVTVPDGIDLLLPDELSLDIDSPYFQADAIPGTSSLPFDLAWTRENLRGLNFPHLFRGPGGPPPVVVDCYLGNQLWRRGKLVYLSVDVVAQRLRYNFVTDAADLATLLKDVKLTSLELGTAPLNRMASSETYALLPVRNLTFYGDADKAPAAYKGFLNYCPPGGDLSQATALAPQPYLVPLVRQVLAHFGYELVGAWAEDEEMQAVCIYSDRLVDDPSTVTLNRHVPHIDVADLLLGVQGVFCLGLFFNPATRQAHFSPLRDVLAGAAAGSRPRPGAWQGATANTTNGFTLRQVPDSEDELDKTLDASWQQLVIGAGGEVQEVKAGTLHMVTVLTETNSSWQVPTYEGKGAVPGNENVGDESRVGLRLLFDRGYQPDSAGQLYPLGSALATNGRGETVGRYSLQWAGPAGLYAQWHQAWLSFRARAVQHTYVSAFTVTDLLLLDPSRADFVDYHLCLWEKVSVTITAGSPLTSASFTYQELL